MTDDSGRTIERIHSQSRQAHRRRKMDEQDREREETVELGDGLTLVVMLVDGERVLYLRDRRETQGGSETIGTVSHDNLREIADERGPF